MLTSEQLIQFEGVMLVVGFDHEEATRRFDEIKRIIKQEHMLAGIKGELSECSFSQDEVSWTLMGRYSKFYCYSIMRHFQEPSYLLDKLGTLDWHRIHKPRTCAQIPFRCTKGGCVMLELSLAVKLMNLPHPATIKEGPKGEKAQAALIEAIGILDNNGFQTGYYNHEFIKLYTAVRSAENLNMICGYLYTENWKWVKFGYVYTAPELMENALAEFIGRAGKLCAHGGDVNA